VLHEHPDLEVVGEAADGLEAVEAAARLVPDVVLMDVGMPRLDGIEATRRIVQAHPRVRVLMLSMHCEDHLVARSLAAGAGGYALKDLPVAELAAAVRTVHAGRRYLSPAAVEKVVDDFGRPLETARSRYDLLTDREREVLKLLADGLGVKQVAARLSRSVKTAEVHTSNLMHKLGLHDRVGLVKYAIAHGVIQVPVLPAPPPARK
jgi:two-component system response regulator NreC